MLGDVRLMLRERSTELVEIAVQKDVDPGTFYETIRGSDLVGQHKWFELLLVLQA